MKTTIRDAEKLLEQLRKARAEHLILREKLPESSTAAETKLLRNIMVML